MDIIIKVFSGLFFFLLTSITGFGIVMAGADAAAAQNYHADVVEEIEASNFSPNVIEACKNQAQSAGYELQIFPMVYDGENNIQMAEITMKYKYSIGILELDSGREIRGMAR